MELIRFESDPGKKAINKRKHGITFDEAQAAFYDENALVIPDQEHSDKEERFLLLGMSSKPRLLVICHCYRESDEIVRIINARKASKRERKQYFRRLS